jgi:hypothetical protein
LAFHSGSEADHSPPYSAEVKECVELYLHSPSAPSWRGAQLGGAQGQLYLYFLGFFSNAAQNYSHQGTMCDTTEDLEFDPHNQLLMHSFS